MSSIVWKYKRKFITALYAEQPKEDLKPFKHNYTRYKNLESYLYGHTRKLGTPHDQQYVIVTIDAFSKYILLYYITNKNPHSKLAALKRTVHLFGAPVQIIVDGGREFLGEFKEYCDNIGINIHAIAPGVSRAND